MDPIVRGLNDRHPYVQRTAVMGVLKVHHIEPSVAENRGLDVTLSTTEVQLSDQGLWKMYVASCNAHQMLAC